jgi:site-specific DNA recombinase
MKKSIHSQVAAIYTRFSDPKQDARSIDDQVRRCRQYAVANGLEVVDMYSDEGITGRHSARPGYQRMLADAKDRRFRYVLIFDIARLGRSLGVLWDTVFGRLKRQGVVVIDVSTNTRSDSSNARMVFGTMGLVSDLWCQMIGDETRKALEGRARAGFNPGGKTYGWRSEPEKNPQDAAHPRKVRVVDADEAKIVLQIFTWYAEGMRPRAIAAELNRFGVGAPHDGKRGNKRYKGWGHGTIRHMLRNMEYCGRDTWGENRWLLLDDGRYEVEPQDDVSKCVAFAVPPIVPQELWNRVQDRLKKNLGKGPRGQFGAGKHRGWLFSGHAVCGRCSGSMMIASRKHTADGRHYANLGCTTYDRTDGTKCPNNRTVSERKVVEAVVGKIREMLGSPDIAQEFVAAAQRSFREAQHRDGGSSDEAERRVREYQSRVDNLTESLARTGFSAAVAARLAKEEAALSEAKAQLASTRPGVRAAAMPSVFRFREGIDQLMSLLDGEDMPKAREELMRHMPPLILTPAKDGWEITGGFDCALFLGIGSVKDVGGTGIEPATRRV